MVVLLRYSEVAIKRGRTRAEMERLLMRALRDAAGECGEVEIKSGPGRVYAYGDDECIKRRAAEVFGVKSLSSAVEFEFKEVSDIAAKAGELWSSLAAGKKFAVRVHRAGAHAFASRDVAAAVGEALVRAGGRVDLENPDVEFYVEVRGNRAYFFTEIVEGPGGLPLGSEGKALALVSGGIDSPVAAWYTMRRGAYVDVLYCNLGGSLAVVSALGVIKALLKWSHGYDARVLVADCAPVADAIRRGVDRHLWSIAFKRALYRLAERAARLVKAEALVTGESLGQVSSQTLQALAAAERGIDMPVLRPLIGMDKEEIVDVAQRIGTYAFSISMPEYCGIFSREPRRWASKSEVELIDLAAADAVDQSLASIKMLRKSELDRAISEYASRASEAVAGEIPKDAVLVDLRDAKSYEKWHLPGAVRLDLDEVFDFVERTGRDKTYMFYCYEGALSADVAERLRRAGYKAYSIKIRV